MESGSNSRMVLAWIIAPQRGLLGRRGKKRREKKGMRKEKNERRNGGEEKEMRKGKD